MKFGKRILAALLAFLMVIGGISYINLDGSVAKAEVTNTITDTTKEMLDIKVQVSSDNSIMRFVSSVDSLDYSQVGFEVTPEGGTTKTYSTTTVYERIASKTEGVEYLFSPKVVDTSSEYFVTAKMYVTAGTDYTVRAFVVSLDGTTKTYGMSRCVAVEDAATGTDSKLNLSFASTADVNAETEALSVTYGADNQTTTAEVVGSDGNTVWARVNVDKATLPSATKFTFSGAAEGSTIYRNLYTSHVPATGTTPVADATWYTVDPDATEFVVATGADLYAIADLVNVKTDNETFAGKKIYLVSDITINEATEAEAAAWTTSETGLYLWEPIGAVHKVDSTNWGSTYNYCFQGTFDGQGHTVNGLYAASSAVNSYSASSTWMIGFFGNVYKATIQNVSVTNSHFSGAYHIGGIVARASEGTNISHCYTNAVIVTSNVHAGGIAASPMGGEIKNCWFDGTVTSSLNGSMYIGGIAGWIGGGGTTKITNCLNTGDVTGTGASAKKAGGITGQVAANQELILTNCLTTGTITAAGGNCGKAVGEVVSAGTLRSVDSYSYTTSNAIGTASGTVYNNETQITTTADKNSKVINQISGSPVGYAAYTATNTFDYVDTWAVMKNSSPVLKEFAEKGFLYTPDVNWEGEGTEAKPYVISTPEELYGLVYQVDVEAKDFAGVYFELGADIVLNDGDAEDYATTAPAYEWEPIGNGTTAFKGSLDGNYHSISGMYANQSTLNGTALFYATGDGAVVKEMKIVNSYLYGQDGVSAFAGWYSPGTFDSLYSDAIVKGRNHVAGIVALPGSSSESVETTISNCWYAGAMSATAQFAGGVISITNANVVVELTDCLFTGTITSTRGSGNAYVGGLIGYARDNVKVTDCLSASSAAYSLVMTGCTGTVFGRVDTQGTYTGVYATNTGYTTVGATKANSGVTSAEDCITVTENLSGYASMTTFSELDFNGAWVVRENSTPVLKDFIVADGLYTPDTAWEGAGTDANPYKISTPEELYGFAYAINNGDTAVASASFELTNDIVLNTGDADDYGTEAPVYNWIPISGASYFSGLLDGNQYSISGLYCKKNAHGIGMFVHTADGCEIREIAIENAYFEATSGKNIAGAVVGWNAAGTFDSIYTDAIVIGKQHVGGIFGLANTSTITDCWFDGKVIANGTYAGGIASQCGAGTISNCLVTGSIQSTVTSGAGYAGGFIGVVQGVANLSDCLVAGDIAYEGSNSTRKNGSIFGNASTAPTATNLHGTKETCGSTIMAGASGDYLSNLYSNNESAYYGDSAYDYFAEAEWTARTGDVPVPNGVLFVLSN